MRVEVNWNGNIQFEAKGGSGHSIIMDAAPEVGGQDTGPRPMELVLSAVGGCTGIDIVLTLKKMRVDFETFSMEINGERANDYPKRFTKVHIHYKLTGENIPEDKVRRAVDLTRDKYCSASNSLNADITTSFEINGIQYE
ncbi:OsmC family protein [Microaerobacter geothermalis]|uniref:OsmC family protein n=1 Tax=Microaerobacter geothermalis TaxID=674972 RepID=UPI001F1CF699|nr:OsmC family protein [Microaerobacter geothermalis]MCF6095287.1 OsmC family protein [Microaerobacter geothermalis]